MNKPLQSTQNLNGKKRSKDPLEESARFQIRTGAAQKQTAAALRTTSNAMAGLASQPNLKPAVRAQLIAAQRQLAQAAAAQGPAAPAGPTTRSRKPPPPRG